MLCVGAVTADSLSDLLVHNDIDLHASFSSSLKYLIKPPLLMIVGWPSQEELRTQPPVLDVDCLFGLLQSDRDSIEVVLSVDVPLDLVAISLGGEGLEAVALCYLGSLLIGGFFMLLVMTMIGVDQVAKLADFVLEMEGAHFGIVEVCIWRGTCCQRQAQGAGSGPNLSIDSAASRT